MMFSNNIIRQQVWRPGLDSLQGH